MAMVKQEILCLCEETFPVEFDNEILLTPQVVEKIHDGSFLSFECPACHSQIKLEAPVTLKEPVKNWELQAYPDMERDHFLADQLKIPATAQRVVFGYKELSEKVQLLNDGLNDQAIEGLKYLFLQKQGWPEGVSLLYKHKTSDKIEFFIEGMRDKEVGITGVQIQFYEKLIQQLESKNEEWQDFITPPYVNVQRISKI